MEGGLLLLGGVVVVGALVGRFYYNLTATDVAYYIIMNTFLGQMMHDTALSKHKNTVHTKPSMTDCGSFVVRTLSFLEDNYVSRDQRTAGYRLQNTDTRYAGIYHSRQKDRQDCSRGSR
jgi:type IV secretory pathway TrbF-like protein